MNIELPWGEVVSPESIRPTLPAELFAWGHWVKQCEGGEHRLWVTPSAVVCACGDSFVGVTAEHQRSGTRLRFDDG